MSDTTEQQQSMEESPTVSDNTTSFELRELPSAHIPVGRQLTVAIAFLVIIFGTSIVSTVATLTSMNTIDDDSDVHVVATLPESVSTETEENPFIGTEIVGKAAYVLDVNAGKVLFNKQGDIALPIASITKLMTALVTYELLDPEALVTLSKRAITTEGDSGFYDQETFTAKDLTDLTLIASSNDGAVALGLAAEGALGTTRPQGDIFVQAMNLRAKELGLTDTVFYNPTGLDLTKTEAGAYSSARDIAFLMEYIVTQYPDVAALTALDTLYVYNEDGEYHTAENTNEIVSRIDGLIASKTGTTPLAGGNLVVAFNAGLNRPIIVVVLGSTAHERFTDVLTLTERARKYVALFTE